MRKQQDLRVKGTGVVVCLLLLTVVILLCGQMSIMFSGYGKPGSSSAFDRMQTESQILRIQTYEGILRGLTGRVLYPELLETDQTKPWNMQGKKAEELSTQEIRNARSVHKQSEVLNNEVQPRNRLPVFLLFLLLTELIWECNRKCQWFGHTEFKEKTYFYSNVSKRRGPPISAVML